MDRKWFFLLILFFLSPQFVSEGSIPTTSISMEYWAPYYEPPIATIYPGVQIEVINLTSSPHTIRDDNCLEGKPCLFDTGVVAPEQSFLLPPLPPGVYTYHCELHPIMRGEIIVLSPEKS